MGFEAPPAKTAGPPLDLVQRFVNTIDLEDGDDELASPGALRDWLAGHGLMDAGDPVSAADLSRAIDVREGLRALLLANNGEPLDGDAVERLDRAAARAGMRLRFGSGEPELVPDARGVDGAIARLMSIVAAAESHGAWERLKACPRHDCMAAFYDRSKNRSGRWCSMDVCGNRAKVESFRARRR
jgi:predicted RNA-binding Zn ribbon-like protein